MIKSKTNKLEIDDINALNRFIAGINKQQLNGEAVDVLSNERIRVKAVLLGSDTDPSTADIDGTVRVTETGRQLRALLESKLTEGITIATKSGEVVRVYQEVVEENRGDVEQILESPSSIPPPPVSAVA